MNQIASQPAAGTAVGYMRLPEILQLFPFGKTTWYALVKSGAAPKPVRIGSAAMWRRSEIAAFLQKDVSELSEAVSRVSTWSTARKAERGLS